MRLIAFALIAVVGSVHAAECKFAQDLDFSLNAGDLKWLNLETGAGHLRIEGVAGSHQIEVRARACASSQKRLDGLRLTHRVNGDSLDIVADDTAAKGWNWSDRAYARIDLDLMVPRKLGAQVNDGSGAVWLNGLAGVQVEDGSGQLEISDIDGDVTIRDGSGSITVDGAGGRVTVVDGSGGIEIDNVQGDVLIEEDGSGGIEIADVTLDVRIEDDGSGGISVRRVGGSIVVEDDGTGDIRVSDVSGDFVVHDAGNGKVRYDNVSGAVQVPRKHRKLR